MFQQHISLRYKNIALTICNNLLAKNVKLTMRFKALLIFGILIGSSQFSNVNSQINISLNMGMMEHNLGVPDFVNTSFQAPSIKVSINYYLDKLPLEIGASYMYFGAGIENHSAYKNRKNYSYWYNLDRTINLMSYVGIYSDQDRLIQCNGGLRAGYWSHGMKFTSQNHSDLWDTETISDHLHYFAIGPSFGLSMGRKIRITLESEHFWLTPTKNNSNFIRVSSLMLGLKYRFNKRTNE